MKYLQILRGAIMLIPLWVLMLAYTAAIGLAFSKEDMKSFWNSQI